MQQEHHQYVIVNQTPAGDHHSHSVAANLSPTAVSANGQVYSTSTIYQPTMQQANGYAMKYIPAYTQASVGTPQIQKVY